MKYPDDKKENPQGVMTDSEMIKSLQDDLKVARDDQKRLATRLDEAEEKNLKYDAISDYYKKLIIDVVNEDGAIDLDELEEKINRRFDIDEYQDDIECMIKEYTTYDPDFEAVVTDKIYETLKNCRIILNESWRGE